MKQFTLICVVLGAVVALDRVSALARTQAKPVTPLYHQESSLRAVHTAQGYRLITPVLPATATK